MYQGPKFNWGRKLYLDVWIWIHLQLFWRNMHQHSSRHISPSSIGLEANFLQGKKNNHFLIAFAYDRVSYNFLWWICCCPLAGIEWGGHESALVRKFFYPVIYFLKRNCRFGLYIVWHFIFHQLITSIDCNRKNTDIVDKDTQVFKYLLFLLCIPILR